MKLYGAAPLPQDNLPLYYDQIHPWGPTGHRQDARGAAAGAAAGRTAAGRTAAGDAGPLMPSCLPLPCTCRFHALPARLLIRTDCCLSPRRMLADLLVRTVQATAAGLAVQPLGGPELVAAGETLVPPMTAGNYETNTSTCWLGVRCSGGFACCCCRLRGGAGGLWEGSRCWEATGHCGANQPPR